MEIHPVCNLSVVNAIAELAGGDAERQTATKAAWMRRVIRPGLVECCLVPQLYNARRWNVDFADLATLSALEAACSAIPAFRSAHPDEAKREAPL